jgi:cell division ATPase FtsA
MKAVRLTEVGKLLGGGQVVLSGGKTFLTGSITLAREVNGLTLRDMQVVWTAPKNRIFGKALDQADIQNLTLDHVSFDPATPAK